jgi:hypothetical protein
MLALFSLYFMWHFNVSNVSSNNRLGEKKDYSRRNVRVDAGCTPGTRTVLQYSYGWKDWPTYSKMSVY